MTAGTVTAPATVRSALPILDDATRSRDPGVCPFFRREVDGALFSPLGSADEENVCVAIGVPKAQSARQQELVCLRVAHADCPRYLRGAMGYPVESPPRRPVSFPRATVAALLILVLSAGISFGFVVQRGGIELPVVAAASGAPASSAVAVLLSPSPAATTDPSPSADAVGGTSASPSTSLSPDPSPEDPSPTPDPTPSPSPTPSPTPSPSPSLAATATPAPTVKPTPRPTKKPTSSRYKLLTACADRSGCWIYRVRAGDNLFSIANYFGHSLNTIYRWNPQYPGTALVTGAKIRMPPPTR